MVKTYGYINCKDCGILIEKKHPLTERCPKCHKEYRKREQKKYYQKKKEAKRVVPEVTVCKKTESCIYGGITGGLRICDYLGITGHSRNCPIEGCTKYEEKGGSDGERNDGKEKKAHKKHS